MKSIYNLLKEEMRQHPAVRKSILANSQPWKRSHYIILSEIIRETLSGKEELRSDRKFELGTTISHITLQRFFENDYDNKTHNDLRFIKTLDKICIFLGFRDLNAYVAEVRDREKNHDNREKQLFEGLIYRYCQMNFELFKSFPDAKLEMLDDLIFEEAPFRERIRNYSQKLSERQLKLMITNNRSNYEIFDLEIISEEPDKVVVKTQEFWNLVFIAENSKEEFLINELNTQIYFIRKLGNTWKIWDNYNPNSGILNHEITKKPL